MCAITYILDDSTPHLGWPHWEGHAASTYHEVPRSLVSLERAMGGVRSIRGCIKNCRSRLPDHIKLDIDRILPDRLLHPPLFGW